VSTEDAVGTFAFEASQNRYTFRLPNERKQNTGILHSVQDDDLHRHGGNGDGDQIGSGVIVLGVAHFFYLETDFMVGR
jgi:hypothetical protein